MPELIRDGYLYIAQPPLYRLAVGKSEHYLKDDDGLNALLLKRASEKKQVFLPGRTEPLAPEQLIGLLKIFSRYEEWIERQSLKGMSRKLIEQVIRIFDENGLEDADPREWGSTLKAKLEGSGYEVAFVEVEKAKPEESGYEVISVGVEEAKPEESGYEGGSVEVEEEHRGHDLDVMERTNGLKKERIAHDFLASVEFRKLLSLYRQLALLHAVPYVVKDNQGEEKFDDPRAFFQHLMDEARKGTTIQRYKGLGEMNPEQLWETTMNPEKRTLLQVRVEDQVLADDLFATLMGDPVEPRREFIQTNALDFRELDI
jgi:DNA gyrase subunit B